MSPALVHDLLWCSALAAMLAAAVATDVASHRIPNRVVAAGLAAAFALSLLPGGTGIGSAAAGMGIGFTMFLPLYVLRATGAGDVKLMAAVGAFAGWPAAFSITIFVLVAGGVLSLAWALRRGILRSVASNLRTAFYLGASRIAAGHLPAANEFPVSAQRVPYALAIATGTALYLAAGRFAAM